MKNISTLKSGILTGTTFALIPHLQWHDIIRTCILASIGALVSALVSYSIQSIRQRVKQSKE
ncbi:MAG: hypothetical protein LBE34_00375 [Flavobacteriaceae bacterium]|nr:hypothetical protein [Flavobacteriaceae bacterium]